VKDLIVKNLVGSRILILFFLTGLIYTLMLTVTIPMVMSFSGGLKILDMMPMGYDFAYVKSLFDALGEEGRNAYLYRQIPLDLLFPSLMGITFCLIFAYLLRYLNKLDSRWFYLVFFPLFAGLFDYCENFGIVTMILSYPDISDGMVLTSSIFSILKSSISTLFYSALIILLVVAGVKKLKLLN
jgi:hypothetical protein